MRSSSFSPDSVLVFSIPMDFQWIAIVLQGDSVEVRVRQDSGQLHFASDPPARRPRHAFLPRWHFDMLADAQRNTAYQTAIERAVRNPLCHRPPQQMMAAALANASCAIRSIGTTWSMFSISAALEHLCK